MSLLQITDPVIGGSLDAHLGTLNVKKLTLNGQELKLLGDSASIIQTIQQIQAKIAELDAFCKALSEAIYIGPTPGQTVEAVYPAVSE